MPAPRQVFIAVIGTGGVGKCFLTQLSTLATRLSQTASPTYLSLVLLARSSRAVFSANYSPIPLSRWEEDLQASDKAVPKLEEIADYLAAAPSPVILVDNTSNQDVGNAYPTFLSKGINIITPNKKAFSSDINLWDSIQAASSSRSGTGGHVFHESSVGAGLPILSTLRDLVETGDVVRKVEGVFSGTMSYLFNSWNPVDGGASEPFSKCVATARELGYTEPDPRDDLNGMDVARKCTILARLAGLKIKDATAFETQSLIPKELESAGSADEFLEGLKKFDGEMEKLKNDAAAKGKVVRFVGTVDIEKGKVLVGLQQFEKSHPIAALKGSDNIIGFATQRYGNNPLIVQGAGAGGEVTAMGVTADLIKVLNLLP